MSMGQARYPFPLGHIKEWDNAEAPAANDDNNDNDNTMKMMMTMM
jgi:hypothetical protein